MNIVLHFILVLGLSFFQFVGPEPTDLGIHNAELSPCASPAHCARANWQVAEPVAAVQALQPLLELMPRTNLVDQSEGYLHATVSSAFFGFVDDLEIYADPIRGLVQARSVSRLGDSDLGVNAKRLADVKLLLQGVMG